MDENGGDIERLGRVVEGEARRMLSGDQFEPDPELVARGWERRFMADARKVEEAAELYESLGYEVLQVPVKKEEVSEDCADCELVMLLDFRTIYVRRK